ncbi:MULTISPECIES: RecQ family ATP-dependent DNA helicase [Gordonia]|uniref:RecQ family ATP-dependent DNA helicase n=1 Tax=Gordonia TaxID=2053 RepID=UPI00133133D9|nr:MULTISPECIES: RecQ family ATP-dependent DNA helicase [Gordonia]KAF0971221.1 ATP-dependent RNA helicase DeaD [Gordonia sp. YY1]MCZ4651084.1 RecQ family ATP-dependent DNA helicase [Gordonia amicalis]
MTESIDERRRAELRRIAREDFGWTTLRPGLIEAMEPLLDSRDVLAAMRTGYGKSAIYQVAGAMLDGITLVISPLIALQHDQVAGISAADDAPIAVALNSALGPRALTRAWDLVTAGGAEYVFAAPEQLAKTEVVDRLRDAGVSLVVVDEAHCIAAWGHDFRPDYLRLGATIAGLAASPRSPRPPVLALTATASPPVRDEIITELRMREPVVVATGFDRPNIRLEVRRAAHATDKRRALIARVTELDGCGLVYVSTHRAAIEYASALRGRGIRAAGYHGGLRAVDRSQVHGDFRAGEVDVVVATSAFGMGIDKHDIRFVVHESVPDSLDDYYQEIGRAGRDGDPALALLFYRPEDLALRRFFAGRHPVENVLRRVFAALPPQGEPIPLRDLGRRLDLRTRTLINSLNLLEQAGAVLSGPDGYRVGQTTADDAVAGAVHAADVGARMDTSRVEMMRGYAETADCRRRFLLGYFGEHRVGACGNCDNCLTGAAPPSAILDADVPFPLNHRVRHEDWGEGEVVRVEPDRVTVLFDEQGYRTLSLDAVKRSQVLRVVGEQ